MKRSSWPLTLLLFTLGAPAFSAPMTTALATDDSFQHVDPTAWSVVQRAADAYAKLHSYTGTMEKHTVVPAGQQWGQSPQRAVIAYKSPNKCSVVIQNDQGIWSSISDGHDVYSTIPNSSNVLKTLPFPNMRVWSGAFGIGNSNLMSLGTGYFATLASSPNDKWLRLQLLDMIYNPEERMQSTVTLDTTKSINGEAVNTVVFSARHFSRQTGEARSFWRTSRRIMAFAKSDGLLRRMTIEFEARPGEKPFVTIETHSVTSLNTPLPDAMFHFTSSGQGAQQVASSEKLYPLQEPMFDPRLKVGTEPFSFTATDTNGHAFSLSDYKGRVVLLDFWATWCGPCVGELPETRVVYDKYHAQGFEVVGISLDEKRDDLLAFIKKEKLPWPQVFDGKGWDSPLAKRYGVRAIPATFLIGRDGRISAVDIRSIGIEPAVVQALAQK